MNLLLLFKILGFKRKYKAKNGSQGKGKNMHGKDAEDTILEVPVGTLIIDENG
jgi:GTP-binding protein